MGRRRPPQELARFSARVVSVSSMDARSSRWCPCARACAVRACERVGWPPVDARDVSAEHGREACCSRASRIASGLRRPATPIANASAERLWQRTPPGCRHQQTPPVSYLRTPAGPPTRRLIRRATVWTSLRPISAQCEWLTSRCPRARPSDEPDLTSHGCRQIPPSYETRLRALDFAGCRAELQGGNIGRLRRHGNRRVGRQAPLLAANRRRDSADRSWLLWFPDRRSRSGADVSAVATNRNGLNDPRAACQGRCNGPPVACASSAIRGEEPPAESVT